MKNVSVVLVGSQNDHPGIPSLAVSILKTSLEERGISCKVLYANSLFYETMGFQLISELSQGIFHNLLFERLFAPFDYDGLEQLNLKGLSGDEIPEFLHKFYEVVGDVDKNISQAKFTEAQERCKIFLEKAVETVLNLQPKIVGFSNPSQQTNSSIAFARAIKKRLPGTICVIGGNNCEGEMGEELAASQGIFDYVFQGEADFAFADFCHNYLENYILPKEKLIRCSMPRDLDAVPIPDYNDFFEQCTLPLEAVTLPFESSRGCWWGIKNQCKFCGESKVATGYRFKSPERMSNELCQLQEKYPGVNEFLAADSIFPNSYFKDFLPRLADSDFHKKIHYSTKTNFTYEQIIQMKEAGIFRIFAGIESLSNRILTMLNKGTNAFINIRLLRDCRELDVMVSWNLLVGIPGDRASDYEEQLKLIPLIQHLTPPHLHPIRVQRSSPYFEDPETYGIDDIKPLEGYQYAFPDSVNVARLAYYFVAKYPSESRERPEILVPLKQQLDRWTERWMKTDVPKLLIRRMQGDQWMVEDSRDCAKSSRQVLNGDDYSLLEQCRVGISSKNIKSSGRVNRLLDLGYLIEVDGKLLSVVCKLLNPKEIENKTS